MDTDFLVTDGAEGLRKIVVALETEGVDVIGAYLIKLTDSEGMSNVAFRIVTNADQRDVISKVVRLRRDRKVPSLADEVRISPLRPDHIEAKRVLEYAAQLGSPTAVIKDVFWDGLFIEEAVVVKWPKAAHALA